MNAFTLKMIALLAMFVDHVFDAFPQSTPLWFKVIGRLTFPIFVFLLAEGFRHTRSPQKFLLRLFAFAIITEPIYDWAFNRSRNVAMGYGLWRVDFLNNTNIFYTLFLGGMAIFAYQLLIHYIKPLCKYRIVPILAALPFAALFMWVAEYLGAPYGWHGVLFIFVMYVVSSPKWLQLAVLAVMSVLQFHVFWPFIRDGIRIDTWFYVMIPAVLVTVPLIAIYNKKRGPSLKWMFYIAYPAHIAVLAAVAYFIM